MTNTPIRIPLESSWAQLENEPDNAYEAFKIYLGLGPERTLLRAYKRAARKPRAKKIPDSWYGWLEQHNWAVRSLEYDTFVMEGGELSGPQQVQPDSIENHFQKLEQYRKTHEQFGLMGFQTAMKSLVLLTEFINKIIEEDKLEEEGIIAKKGEDPKKTKKRPRETPRIDTLKSGRDLAHIIQTLGSIAPDMWARSLAIPQLQQKIQEAEKLLSQSTITVEDENK